MTKAHQFKWIIFVFCLGDIFVDFIDVTDLVQHVEYRFMAPPCDGPIGGNPRRYRRVWVALVDPAKRN